MEKTAEQLLMSDTEAELNFDDMYPIVEASKLSEDDNFMKHEPKTKKQAKVKRHIIEGIKSGGIPDFRHPFVDPSVRNKEIVFEKGNAPAIGHILKWWDRKLKNLKIVKNPRIGTETQYCAFLGVLIKYLIEEEGYEVSKAWEAICDDSRQLGHYRNSVKAKKHAFEPTGSRPVGKWHDHANTFKIVKGDDGKRIFLASGYYYKKGEESSFATFEEVYFLFLATFEASVAWIVCDV